MVWGARMADGGCRMLDVGCWVLDVGCCMRGCLWWVGIPNSDLQASSTKKPLITYNFQLQAILPIHDCRFRIADSRFSDPPQFAHYHLLSLIDLFPGSEAAQGYAEGRAGQLVAAAEGF